MTTTEQTPLPRSQDYIVARYKRFAEIEQAEQRTGKPRDKRAAIARQLLSREGARPLMPDDAPADVVQRYLTENFPEQPPGMEFAAELAMTHAANVAAHAFNLAVEVQQLAEALWSLGRGDVAAGMLDDDGFSRHDQPALQMLVRFYRTVGVDLPTDDDGRLDPDLARAVAAVDGEGSDG